jgi:hypothetical protein
MDTTTRFRLPLMQPGQAQKEVTHNEAILSTDALLHLAVEDFGRILPPAELTPGGSWIVGADPRGDWQAQAGKIAHYGPGGWIFFDPVEGLTAWVKSSGVHAIWRGGAWNIEGWPVTRLIVGGKPVVGMQQPAIAEPQGGSTVDAESRLAVTRILAALRAHGLISA